MNTLGPLEHYCGTFAKKDPRKVKKKFMIAQIGEKCSSIGVPPFFQPNFFLKMTQNGLKWILNTTFKNEIFEPAR